MTRKMSTLFLKKSKNFPGLRNGPETGGHQSWWLKFFRWLIMMSAKSCPVVGGV